VKLHIRFHAVVGKGWAAGLAAIVLATHAAASTCPFDTGGSDALNDGVVLTRYALGITGAPLIASTRYASLDPMQVKANIECVGCALDINGDGVVDTVDTTIIARRLAGFQGASLTAGLALGSGSRPDLTAVTSFLVNGCAVGGAINAFVQGGNSFGVAGVLGTNDVQPLTLRTAGAQINVLVPGGNGLRIGQPTGFFADAPTVNNGSANNSTTGQGLTVAGGGYAGNNCVNPITGAVDQSCGNRALQDFATVGGGTGNNAFSDSSTIAGGTNNLSSAFAAAIGGGSRNVASGQYATVPGGRTNTASGSDSFAAGYRAKATHSGSFVWADFSGPDYGSVAINSFNIRAGGGVHLDPTTRVNFGASTRQMINLWGLTPGIDAPYGIGVQANTTYFRTDTNAGFCWFHGGVHSDAQCNPGTGGNVRMQLSAAGLNVNGGVTIVSDRNLKENIQSISAKDMLAKVIALPMNIWNYKQDTGKVKHIGPMAQDFKRLFNVGQDDKTISTIDASGVAIAAIQGLNLRLSEQVRAKDSEIAKLKARLVAIEKRLGL